MKAPDEAELALTLKSASPNVWLATVNVIAAGPGATVNVAIFVLGPKPPAAACAACSTTVPAPVKWTVLPLMVAGPETTVYVNAPPDAEVALTVKSASPKVQGLLARVGLQDRRGERLIDPGQVVEVVVLVKPGVVAGVRVADDHDQRPRVGALPPLGVSDRLPKRGGTRLGLADVIAQGKASGAVFFRGRADLQ